MSLTAEQRSQMEQIYATEHHGFHSGTVGGLNVNSLSPADYERLWETPFSEFLKNQGFATAEQATNDFRTNSKLEDIFGLLSLKDGSGRLFDYVIDSIYDASFGDILTHKSQILAHFNKEKEEITSDFEENFGAKKQQFLTATGYTAEDGDEKGYFFRFWRYPVSKTFAYRGIDISTPAGQESADKILTALFGVNAKNYPITDLMNDTPEHLVEQRDMIEERQRTSQREKDMEKQRLMDQPFYEMLIFSGLTFADITDTETVAQNAFRQPLAHRQLSEYLTATDPFDEATFRTVISMTPNQIKSKSSELADALMLRTDDRFLTDHPEATLDHFLTERRGKASPTGAEEDRAKARTALQQILSTTYPVDDKAVQDCLTQKCADLRANSTKIIRGIKQRKRRRLTTLITLTTTLSLVSLWGLYRGVQAVTDGITSLGEKAVATTGEYAKKIKSASPAADKPTTVSSVSDIKNLSGNRPVLGFYWKGWQDRDCTREEPNAFQQVITGEFNHVLDQIKKSNLTFDTFFNPAHITKRVMASGAEWQPETSSGQIPVRFYIATQGKNADAAQNKLNKENLAKDILNYYYNVQDVLNNLPVSKNLAENQALAMDAIGPTIGWSIRQQLSWAQKNTTEMQSAAAEITKGAQGILTAQKADKSDVDAVFRATCLSVKSYRENHPDIQSYLLLADKSIRQIAGIEAQDLTQFAHFKPSDMKQAQAHIEQVERDLYGAKSSSSKAPYRPAKKSGYPWGWIIGTAAVTLWLTSAIVREKSKIIR